MLVACFAAASLAQEIKVPTSVTAGDESAISTTGSGTGTFYLVGPGVSRKSEVSLGQEIPLRAQDLRNAGSYMAIVCSGTCQSAVFYVGAAKPFSLAFLVHPSRVPVGQPDAVSGVAFPFDQFRNLVLTSQTINFQLTTGNSALLSREVRSQDGVAWFRTSSGKSAGLLHVNAALEAVTAKRAVQQVASDPCNLRINGQRTPAGIVVQTEPVHDCAGNPVPDGTIVTFTAAEAKGKNTVDAPIKKGIARAQMSASGPVLVSAASGVVIGNELRIEAQR
ncbi:MAG: hypothetical protein WB729_07505 [Candidatus Sulfotelmatobacter sp.]